MVKGVAFGFCRGVDGGVGFGKSFYISCTCG